MWEHIFTCICYNYISILNENCRESLDPTTCKSKIRINYRTYIIQL